ncbi:MAG: hypothetical protein HOP02_00465 [Methylococcaceae bacterium]|nr:hypothetical protein [Methylococcaceae bacterium]
MTRSIKIKRTAFSSISAVVVLAASQGAFAHTRLETATVPEATRVHNALNVSHGCADPTGALAGEGALKNQPTRGTTVVFPNAISYLPIIGVDSTSDGKGTAKVYTPNKADAYYTPLAGIGQLIHTGGPWDYTNIKVDALKNKDGFWAGGAPYDQTISTYVQVAFYSAAVTIAPTSCARSVTFELAVADICDLTAKSPNIGDAQALFWSPIPNFEGVPGQPFGAGVGDPARANNPVPVGPKFSNYDGWSNGDKVGMGAATAKAGDGWNSPATLKVTRDLVKNPLPASCTGNAGKGDDVYIYPSAEQINKELPVWSNPDQTGSNYWK